MSEHAVTALQGASFDGQVAVREAPLRGMITLKGDLSDAAVASAVAAANGAEIPASGGASGTAEAGCLWMAPDEVLLTTALSSVGDHVAQLNEALGGHHVLVADVTGARAILVLEGSGAAEVLAKASPADLHPSVFTPGTFRRTRLAQIPAAFWCHRGDLIEVFCFRSVARYAFDLLANGAKPGSEVGYF
ncbi:MAG: sarcosine oxidase subunit gamma family protein [Pseudomonadota bacterium]